MYIQGKTSPRFSVIALKAIKMRLFFTEHGVLPHLLFSRAVFTAQDRPVAMARFKSCMYPLLFAWLSAKNKVIFYRTKVLPPHNKALFYPSRRRISGPLQGATDNIFFYRTGILHLPVLQKHAAGQKRNDGKLLNTN